MNNIPVRSSIVEPLLRVRRRCLVCEVEAELEEREDTEPIGRPCATCQAPTERVEVLERYSRRVTANPHAAALGRLGGLKGGPARAAALSPERRRAIARNAAKTRWRRDKSA